HLDGIDANLWAWNFRDDTEGEPFVRLNADGQHVGVERRGRIPIEENGRNPFQLHGDRARALGQALAGAEKERHAGPAPVVNEYLQRDEGFGPRFSSDARLLPIAGDGLTETEPGHVLTPHDLPVHRL